MKSVNPALLRACALALALLQPPAAATAGEPPYQIEAPSPSDLSYLDAQRQRVAELLDRRLGAALSGNRDADLALLQQLLEHRSTRPGQTASLHAMGVALGDLLAAEYGLQWVASYDSQGRHRALASASGQVIDPVPAIATLLDSGARPDLRALYRHFAAQVSGR